MRRSALLGTMVFPTVLLLGGCSGLGKFFGDTITLPGMNPNLPYGTSENVDRARGQKFDEAPIMPEAGNVWPGPPQPLPTLTDVSRQQGNGLGGNLQGGISGSSGSSGNNRPTLRDGGSMSMGEGDSVARGALPAPDDVSGADSFAGGGTLDSDAPGRPRHARARTSPDQNSPPIVIPNGDGTSTVISSDGTVKTVKGVPKSP
jgi:hypothetical protein